MIAQCAWCRRVELASPRVVVQREKDGTTCWGLPVERPGPADAITGGICPACARETLSTRGPLVYIAGRRDREDLARRAMDAVQSRSWRTHDWLYVYRLYACEGLSLADALAGNRRALDECRGLLLVEPARADGWGEAAYVAGRGRPVVVWATAGTLDRSREQLWELLGQRVEIDLEVALDALARAMEEKA